MRRSNIIINNDLKKAIDLLNKKYGVVAEAYSFYDGCYFLLAFKKGLSLEKKKKELTPYYLVDLKTKRVGPFSRMFDPKGYDLAVEQLKKIE